MADPIVPLAPLRLSTITVWPSASLSLEATSRAIMSTVGPGGTGTTMVIGLAVGQVCCAEAGTRAAKMESPHRIAVIERNVLMIQLGSVYFGGFHSPSRSIRTVSDADRFTDFDGIASHLPCETNFAYQVARMGDDNAAAEHPMVDFFE